MIERIPLTNGHYGRGPTGLRRDDRLCSDCGSGSFDYNNGHEWSRDGVRGYRCACGTIKPEATRGVWNTSEPVEKQP
jgi:hypothetical protein